MKVSKVFLIAIFIVFFIIGLFIKFVTISFVHLTNRTNGNKQNAKKQCYLSAINCQRATGLAMSLAHSYIVSNTRI